MKRAFQTLLVLTTAAAVCSPAFAIGEKKEERFVLSSATPPTHRTDNTAITGAVRTADKKDLVFAIGLEALKWVGASSRQVGVPYPDLWCADFVNFVLRRTGYPQPIHAPPNRSSTTASASTAPGSARSSC